MNSVEWAKRIQQRCHLAMERCRIIQGARERMQEHYRERLPLLPGTASAVQQLAALYPPGLVSTGTWSAYPGGFSVSGHADTRTVSCYHPSVMANRLAVRSAVSLVIQILASPRAHAGPVVVEHAYGGGNMQVKRVVAEAGTGLIGGYVGTKVMEPLEMKLYAMESEAARQQEDRVRPGSPYDIAARKTTEMLGLHLGEQQLGTVGKLVFHYGLGMSWGVVTVVFQRRARLNPLVAGALSGAAMSLIVDEGMTPAFGFSAPNSAYPLSTHIRGFIGHVVFGMATATTAALIRWFGRHDAGR